MSRKKNVCRAPSRPIFNKNRDFGKAMESLDRNQRLLVGKQRRSPCRFPTMSAENCGQDVVGGHTIQEAILESIASVGHVKSFSRDVSAFKRRLVEDHKAESITFFEQRRWSPDGVGIHEASVYYFTCEFHDAKLFEPIEYRRAGHEFHPLANPPFSAEQYFLLAYRISMMSIEQLERVGLMLTSTSENLSRDSRVLLETRRTEEVLRTREREKARFDECYLKGDYDSLIETPISAVVELPLRIAVADTYAFAQDTRMGEVFLTILPFDQSTTGEEGLYCHRVFASLTNTKQPSKPGIISEIKRMIAVPSQSQQGHFEFLHEVMSGCRNTFFGYEYDRLPADLRESVEKDICNEAVRLLQKQLPRHLQ